MTTELQSEIKERQKLHILVADDEKVIRDLFTRFLSKKGYAVFTASDGFEALHKIKGDNFDILIMDLKMPRMSGMELLEEIRELKGDLIIIVITGYATIETAKEAMKQGCFDYITKPFNLDDIDIIIKRALDMRNLTEQKKRLQEQLEIAQRLAFLALMGAGVAHEVNTVLTSTKLFLELQKPKLEKMDNDRNIGIILDEIERAENLICRFLNFAKPREPEFVVTDINKVIKKSLQFLKFRFEKQKIEINEELNPQLPQIFCDPADMDEVFLNIFSNSIEAMTNGGRLRIKSEFGEADIIITISDNGTGILPQDMPKLFTPFFSTKRQGTGLGLSIVHRIIDEHKGVITINSDKDKGTTVCIELPINAADHKPQTKD